MLNKIDFNGKVWFEGSFDEWIFAWSKDEKVLLVTYANGDKFSASVIPIGDAPDKISRQWLENRPIPGVRLL